MKYIIRSIKYFFYLMLVLCLILVIMITAGLVEGNIANMFVETQHNSLDDILALRNLGVEVNID